MYLHANFQFRLPTGSKPKSTLSLSVALSLTQLFLFPASFYLSAFASALSSSLVEKQEITL